VIVFFISIKQYGQHHTEMKVELNMDKKTLNIQQDITFFNNSTDTLTSICLNDWINAYSSKDTPLAERFSDEFYRGFHLAKDKERGGTSNLTIIDNNDLFLTWVRPEKKPDIVFVSLREKLDPQQSICLRLTYVVKIPSDKFTKFGYSDAGKMNLKNWFLTPARYENHAFIENSNVNLEDCANGISSYTIEFKVPKNEEVISDLNSSILISKGDYTIFKLTGTQRTDFSLFIEPKSSFYHFKTNDIQIDVNLKDDKTTAFQKALIVDRVATFVDALIGHYPHEKITVSQTDYDRNPFYGLNQLPAFISPFPDEFIYEIKFLKTYLNQFLKNSLQLDPRKDNWIYDGIQMYAMMKYIEENHPNSKMLGSLSQWRLLKSYNLTNIDFNEQYSYYYMLMARKNLDQPLGNSKSTLIKFNEQIASKYRAGLSLKYLDEYLKNQSVINGIQQFYFLNKQGQVKGKDFELALKSNTNKDINWFFTSIINSREIFDYKFYNVTKTNDSITFSLKNKTNTFVPIPIYGINKGEIVFKKWLEPINNDSTYTIERYNADKIVLNYKNEVPEFNLRNNWKSLKNVFPNNRPIKFNLMKDLEDPNYNQILYVPTIGYNYYDGITMGIRLHNKTILDKPFTFDVNPEYSTKAKTLSGLASFGVNQYNRDTNWYLTRYSVSGSYYHYAPDATYFKLNPMIQFRLRESDFRDNHRQLIQIRHVIVSKQKSEFVVDNSIQNYSVFNVKYQSFRTEITKHFNLIGDLQLSSTFGKVIAEAEYRKLFENNRKLTLRLYAGRFLFNRSNSDFFSFALDRPSDYLFDYGFYGRSESTGFFSQQFIMAEGGFKSKLNPAFANQWIATGNLGYTVWNWIEVYADLGMVKNKYQNTNFVYDSGVRLNLVPDYFEVFFPVYSNAGWEITQQSYNQKVRFIITLSPRIFIDLFTRKWF
jgi:hypothetical protein